jgi:acetylornithine deacetylase
VTTWLPRIAAAVEALTPELLAFAQRLIRTPSLPGHERPAQLIAAEAMRAHGLETTILTPTREELAAHPAFCDDGLPIDARPSVVGRLRAPHARTGARSIILNGHLDVVSPGRETHWTDSPWSGRVDGGRLYGRGACDMKTGVACALFAVVALQRAGLVPGADVILQTVSGEESGGIGTLTTIVRGVRADAAIILEPTSLKLCPVQAGALTFRLTVRGRSAHGAMKRSGVSAMDKLRPLLEAIDRLDEERHRTHAHALYPDPKQIAPISVGVVRAGDWPSSVPDEAVAEGRFGVFPGEAPETARASLTAALAAVIRRDEWLRTHPPMLEWFEGQFESGETARDAPIVRALAAQHQVVLGAEPTVEGVTYGSDLRLFTNHASMDAVLYGPGHIEQAHAADEWIEVADVVAACTVVALTVAAWTGAYASRAASDPPESTTD